MRTGALIVASLNLDKKSRDEEEMPVYLPMQHLDGTTVIKREILMLRRAGITPIIVLCGYQKEVLKNHLSHNGVIFCEDEQFEHHRFEETLQVGLDFAKELCDRVLIVPVEYPVFSHSTAERLLECKKAAVPVYQGQPGYPKLWYFTGGDEETLFSDRDPEKLEVEDRGILYALTQEHGFERIRDYSREQRESNVLRLKLKVMLTKEEDFFGPGVYQLLRCIDEEGSIQAAAGKMHMSYSKCWKMINRVEEQMGFKFVNRVNGGKHGGSSSLTEEARIFLDRYKALTEDIRRMSQNFFDVYFREYQ